MAKVWAAAIAGLVVLSYPANARINATAAFADPVATLQGEWVSRFCDKTFRWKVDGDTVYMAAHGSTDSEAASENRYRVGAPVFKVGSVAERGPNIVNWNTVEYSPEGIASSFAGHAALVIYAFEMPNEYFGFRDMIRPDTKAKQCR